jgi:hypothetical protein
MEKLRWLLVGKVQMDRKMRLKCQWMLNGSWQLLIRFNLVMKVNWMDCQTKRVDRSGWVACTSSIFSHQGPNSTLIPIIRLLIYVLDCSKPEEEGKIPPRDSRLHSIESSRHFLGNLTVVKGDEPINFPSKQFLNFYQSLDVFMKRTPSPSPYRHRYVIVLWLMSTNERKTM